MQLLVRILLAGALCLLWAAQVKSATQLRPALIQVKITSPEELRDLLALGLDIIEVKPGEYAKILVSDQDLTRLVEAGYGYDVIYADMVAQAQAGLSGQLDMGGYHTLDEVYAALDSIHTEHPSITTARDSIGYTIQGRAIYAMKISDNPETDEGEPEVFFNSLTHAREPMGMETNLYFMRYLTNNYGSNSRVDSIVNNRELWFIPVVNPDGYEYNRQIAPLGGGLWRKNRRNNGNGSFGVDLNRNYGHQWGFDNIGSSGTTTAQTYRGTAPFSEPETQAMRDFVLSHDFVITINYHTYGDLLLYTWGYTPMLPPDRLIYEDVAQAATVVNNYYWGPGYTSIYPTNGDADDWMYGEMFSKKKSLSFTPEVGTSFWPPDFYIPIMTAENLEANLLFAELAGPLSNRSFWSLGTEPVFIDTVVYFGDSLVLPLILYNHGNNGTVYLKAVSTESPNWLVLNPENVTTAISPSDSDGVSLKFSPQGLAIGNTYYTEILLATHNDSTPALSDTAYIPVQVQVLCSGLQMPGDANASGNWTLGDLIATVNYIFDRPGFPPCASNNQFCWLSELLCRGDWDGSATVTLSDVIHGVNFIFKGGIWYPLDSGVCCAP